MIVPFSEILDNLAKSNGHANGSLVEQFEGQNLSSLYKEAVLIASRRAFISGWNERAKKVGYDKKHLATARSKEIDLIQQKLFPF